LLAQVIIGPAERRRGWQSKVCTYYTFVLFNGQMASPACHAGLAARLLAELLN
jgi:hypothetical protein